MSWNIPPRITRAAGGLIVVVVALLIVAPSGTAQEDTNTEDDWAFEERVLVFESDADDGFEFESTRDTNVSHDIIRGAFDLETATYRLDFILEPQEGTEGIVPENNRTWFRTTLQFIGLVEFEDVTGDGTFSPPTDEVVDRIDLEGYRTPIMRTTTGPDDRTRQVSVEFPFSSGGGLELDLQVSPTAHMNGDQRHPPTVTAFDVRLADYPYEREDTNVALHTQLSTTTSLDSTERGSHINVETEDPDEFDFQGRYAWNPALNGTTDTVNTTVIELPGNGAQGQDRANVLFAYPRSDSIEHSGHFGFHETPTFSDTVLSLVGNWYLFASGILVAGGIIGGTMYYQLTREDTQAPEI